MEQSIEGARTIAPTRRWIREVPAAAAGEGPNIAFKLLIVFLLMLYSSIAVMYKPLEAFRPVLLIAGAAIGMLVIELPQTRHTFKLAWPEGAMLAAVLAAAFVSSFDALWPGYAFNKTADLAKMVLIYVLIENTIKSRNRLRLVLWTMVIGGLFPALGTIRARFIGDLVEGNRARWIGVFANPNEDAYSLVILVPLAVALMIQGRWIVRIVLGGTISAYLLAIFLTYSRGGLLGLFAVIALIGWKQKSIAIRSVMVAGLVASVFLAGLYRKQDFKDIRSDTTYNQRIATIKAGINMFYANPLLGVGPGCSVVGYALYVPADSHCGCQLQLVIHNTPVQALSELGLFGFIPFVVFIGMALVHARQLQKGPLSSYSAALEVALWGFVICGMSGGFSYSWWPYILAGLVAAARHVNSAANSANSAN